MRVVAALLCLVLAACTPPKTEVRETRYVFGTLVEFVIRGADEATAKHAIAAVDRDFQRMHKDWHAWKSGGELVALNEAIARGEDRAVSPFVLPLIERGRAFEDMSGGLFNPAIGNLVDMWGFHADESPQGRIPDLAAVRALAAQVPSMHDLTISDGVVHSANRAVSLDFGGFAKGVAMDMAVAKLKTMGIENAIVNAGGGLSTLGDAGERMWKLGIRDPRDWGVIASVDLMGGESLHTSGNYERFVEADGVRYSHILDPHSGMPVDHLVSVSVIHSDGALADAAATALTVAGPQAWAEVAKSMGIVFVMVVDKQGTVYASPEMLARVTFEPGKALKVVASEPLSQGVILSQMRQSLSPSIR